MVLVLLGALSCLYWPIHNKFYIMLLFNHTLIILLPSGIPVERVSETNSKDFHAMSLESFLAPAMKQNPQTCLTLLAGELYMRGEN